MLRPTITVFYCSDADPLDEWQPATDDWVLWIDLDIEADGYACRYTACVGSPTGLARAHREARQTRTRTPRAPFSFHAYEWEVVKARLTAFVESCADHTEFALTDNLARRLRPQIVGYSD
ncbi:MAG: hypothetical protein AAF735_04120 [Myxococcota bacterium]